MTDERADLVERLEAVIEKRRATYERKAASADPFADDIVNRRDLFTFGVGAMDWLVADLIVAGILKAKGEPQ